MNREPERNPSRVAAVPEPADPRTTAADPRTTAAVDYYRGTPPPAAARPAYYPTGYKEVPHHRRESDGMGAGTVLAVGLSALAVGAVAYSFLGPRREDDRPPDDAAPRLREDGDWRGRYAVAGKSVLINRPRAEVYAYWRDLSNHSMFMENVESVSASGTRSSWTMTGLPGQTVEIEVELTEDRENELLAFSSVEGSDMEMHGRAEFRDAPAGRGTYVVFVLEYVPPAGRLGRTVANLTRRSPQLQARHGLKRLKMLLEAGEVATSAHNRAEQQHGDRNAHAQQEETA